LTLQDFVSNQGKFIGTAAQFKIPFEEVAAAMATLTRNAIPADTAAMAINQTMMAYLKPTDDAVAAAQKYGIELSANTLKTKGFGGAMMDLANAMQDDNSEIAQMFPNVRSLKAVLPLSGLAAQEFAKDLNEVGNAAGTTTNMFEKNKGSLQNILKTVWGKFQLILINIGEKIIPKLESALNAVGRVLDGKNKAFNTFASVITTVAKGVWNLADALLKMYPILLMVAGAFAAVKIAGFASGIASAATAIPLLNNVIANLQLGFATGAASIGGFATSVGTIGLMAAPAALAVAWFVKSLKDTDAAAEAGWKSMQEYDKAAAANGETLYKLYDRYKELQSVLADTSKSEEDHAAASQELASVKAQIVEQFPEVVAGLDSERNAILKSDEAIQQHIDSLLKYRQISSGASPDKSDIQNYTEIAAAMKEASDSRGDVENSISAVTKAFEALGETTGIEANLGQLWHDLATDPEKATEATQEYFDMLKGSGQLPGMGLGEKYMGVEPEALAEAQRALAAYQQAVLNAGGSLGDLDDRTAEAKTTLLALAGSMVEAANQAGIAGQAIPDHVVQAFQSADADLQAVGVQSFSAYISGLSQGQIAPDMAGKIAQQMFNSGTFTSTGVAAVDTALAAMQSRMNISKLASTAQTLAASVSKAFEGISGGKTEEKKVAVKVTDGGTAAATNKSLKQVEAQATTVGNMKPSVHASANTAQANAAIARLVNRLNDINGQTLATVYVEAKIKGSGPFTTDEYVQYLEDKIGGAAPTLSVNASAVSSALDDLNAAWDALNATALPNWSTARLAPGGDMSVEDWEHINEAIANLGGNVDANLNAWWNLNGAMIAAKESAEAYSDAIEASEKRIDSLQKKQTALNESLTQHKNRLSELSQMKIKGETAADDKSFAQTQELNKLELERMQIQQKARAGTATSADYERLYVIAQKKKELELQKSIDDLQTSITYDPQRRQIEKLLDPLKGQEKTQKQIVAEIKKEQKAIATKEKQLKKVTRELERERAKVAEIKTRYDKATKAVQNYSTKIDEMARNFLDHYQKMIAAQEELNRQMNAGGTMGASETMGAGNERTLSEAAGSVSTTTSTTSVSYFYFDRLVLEGVQDVPTLEKELRMAKLRMSV
jgi:hypothetical protein